MYGAPALALCFAVMALAASARADVSHTLQQQHAPQYELSTPPPPPRPYVFSYAAGRYPGHADRTHSEVSDGSGVIRGQYAYVDPSQQVRTVQYEADSEGFHPVLSHAPPSHPAPSAAVARATQRHLDAYNRIAEKHANHPYPEPAYPRQSEAVRAAAEKHQQLFESIAAQHAAIAAQREAQRREFEATSIPNHIEEYKEHY